MSLNCSLYHWFESILVQPWLLSLPPMLHSWFIYTPLVLIWVCDRLLLSSAHVHSYSFNLVQGISCQVISYSVVKSWSHCCTHYLSLIIGCLGLSSSLHMIPRGCLHIMINISITSSYISHVIRYQQQVFLRLFLLIISKARRSHLYTLGRQLK